MVILSEGISFVFKLLSPTSLFGACEVVEVAVAQPRAGCAWLQCSTPSVYTWESLVAEQMLDANPCLKPCFDHLLLLLLFHPSKYFPCGLHPTNCLSAHRCKHEKGLLLVYLTVLSCTFDEEEIAKQPLHTPALANPSLYYCWAVSILWPTRKYQFKVQV